MIDCFLNGISLFACAFVHDCFWAAYYFFCFYGFGHCGCQAFRIEDGAEKFSILLWNLFTQHTSQLIPGCHVSLLLGILTLSLGFTPHEDTRAIVNNTSISSLFDPSFLLKCGLALAFELFTALFLRLCDIGLSILKEHEETFISIGIPHFII